MLDAGINDGDLLIVDRALHAKHKDIVCAVVDNVFAVKFLHTKPRFKLVAADSTFPNIVPKKFQEAHIWGVVTPSIIILTK